MRQINWKQGFFRLWAGLSAAWALLFLWLCGEASTKPEQELFGGLAFGVPIAAFFAGKAIGWIGAGFTSEPSAITTNDPAANQSAAEEMADLQDKVSAILDEVLDLKAEVLNLKAEDSDLRAEISEANGRIDVASGEIWELRGQITDGPREQSGPQG